MGKKTWTKYKLTEAQLRRLAQLESGHPHLHGTSMAALERKGLAEEKPRRCPKCGSTTVSWMTRYYSTDTDHDLDLLCCDNGHKSDRRDWGGTYQRTHQLTTAGQEAFDEARREGW